MQGEISDDEFREYFLQFGDIEDCVVRHIPPSAAFVCALSSALNSKG